MKSITLWCCLSFMISLIGCNSSNDTQDTNRNISGNVIYGKIISKNGTPLSNAFICLMNRNTHEKFETISMSDGSYKQEVSAGPYDFAVYAKDFVTRYVGPLVITDPLPLNMTLDETIGMDTNRLFGILLDKENKPLPGVTIQLIRNNLTHRFSGNPSVISKSDGSFEFNDIPESYLDMIFSAPEIGEEVVDIVKTDMPCRVDFHIGTSTVNKKFPGMATYDNADQYQPNFDVSPDTMASCTINPEHPIPVDGIWRLVIGCGDGVFTKTLGQEEIVTKAVCPIPCWELTIKDDGAWWYKYAVHTHNSSFTGLEGFIYYDFTTGKGDHITMTVFTQGDHTESFCNRYTNDCMNQFDARITSITYNYFPSNR